MSLEKGYGCITDKQYSRYPETLHMKYGLIGQKQPYDETRRTFTYVVYDGNTLNGGDITIKSTDSLVSKKLCERDISLPRWIEAKASKKNYTFFLLACVNSCITVSLTLAMAYTSGLLSLKNDTIYLLIPTCFAIYSALSFDKINELNEDIRRSKASYDSSKKRNNIDKDPVILHNISNNFIPKLLNF